MPLRLPVSLDKVNERLKEHHGVLTHVIDGKRVESSAAVTTSGLKVLVETDLACFSNF
jgi:hypothetical protein